MSGIFGIVSHTSIDVSRLNQTIATLQHRGTVVNFDNDLQNVSFVNYLKYIELAYINDNFINIVDAKIYNLTEIKTKLGLSQSLNISQNEIILKAYIEWGEKCVEHFEGKWALAIYDKQHKNIFLSRDRFGMCPLYYSISNRNFIFSSEIKAIYSYDDELKKINQNQLYQYLVFGKTLQKESTLFNDIIELQPAHNLIYNTLDKSVNIKNYYNIRENIYQQKLNTDSIYNKYDELLNNSIQQIGLNDSQVGVFLSGGLDSSSISAILNKNRKFTAFTATYANEDVDESIFAKSVSKHLSINNHYLINPDSATLWNDFRKIVWHNDLPIASTTIFAQWELFKNAKEKNIDTIVSGTGADGPLGGFSISAGILLFNLLKKLQFLTFLNEYKHLKTNRSINPSKEIVRAIFNILPYHYQELLRPSIKQIPYLLESEFTNQSRNYKIVNDGFKNSDFTSFCIRGIQGGLVELLRYEDRNSNAFGIEGHTPFLNRQLVEFTLGLSDDFKLKNGFSKYILRKTVEPLLPSDIVWRQDKKGFSTPQQLWKKQLQNKINEFINETTIPSIFNKVKVLEYVSIKNLNDNELSEFWRFISVLIWFDTNKLSI